MRLFNSRFIPMFVVRLRNRLVDQQVARDFAGMPPQKFRAGLDERGLLMIEEKHGPVYPPILEDLQATLSKYSDRITDDVLRACAKDIDGYRGFVNVTQTDGKTLEFFYPHGEVYVHIAHGTHRVVVRTTLQAKFLLDGYEVVAQLLYNLEDVIFAPLSMAAE